jgi:hypothetical protein
MSALENGERVATPLDWASDEDGGCQACGSAAVGQPEHHRHVEARDLRRLHCLERLSRVCCHLLRCSEEFRRPADQYIGDRRRDIANPDARIPEPHVHDVLAAVHVHPLSRPPEQSLAVLGRAARILCAMVLAAGVGLPCDCDDTGFATSGSDVDRRGSVNRLCAQPRESPQR